MGTPDFAVPTLNALHEAGHEIAMVYSQPPRRAGRGKKLTPTPVDSRLLEKIPAAVAQAAVESGVARKPYPAHYPLKSVKEIYG